MGFSTTEPDTEKLPSSLPVLADNFGKKAHMTLQNTHNTLVLKNTHDKGHMLCFVVFFI